MNAKNNNFIASYKKFTIWWLLLSTLLMGFDAPWLGQPDSFEAAPYISPPPPIFTLKLIDNGDATITTPDYGRMWTQKDSYADLGNCLNYSPWTT